MIKMMYKFEGDHLGPEVKIVHTISEEEFHSLDEILEHVARFLNAAGYSFVKGLEVIKDDE